MSLQTGKTIPVRSKCCKATMKMSKIGEKPNWVMCTACGQDCDMETVDIPFNLKVKEQITESRNAVNKIMEDTNAPSKGWEERFDKEFPKDDGLFNTVSGWRIKADPMRLKLFISLEIESAKKKVLLDLIERQKVWRGGLMIEAYAIENGINLENKN